MVAVRSVSSSPKAAFSWLLRPAVDAATRGGAVALAGLRILVGTLWLYNVVWKRPPDFGKAADRGLLFMCFQANIKRQFQFIQRTWVDNPNFPVSLLNPFKKDTGDDPLIGQDNDEAQRWPKKWICKRAFAWRRLPPR